MPSQAKPIPQGYRSVTPYLTLNDTARALDFYKRAFGAQEVVRMDGPDGKIGHAEIKIGDSVIMLGDEMPGSGARSPQSLGGTTAGVFLYVENVDGLFKQAVAAGAQAEAQPVRHVLGRPLRQAQRSVWTLVGDRHSQRRCGSGGDVETDARGDGEEDTADQIGALTNRWGRPSVDRRQNRSSVHTITTAIPPA